MSRSRLFSFVLALALFGGQAVPVRAQTPSIDDAIAAIRAYAPTALSQQGAPGMSLTITDRAKTIAIITEGVADLASRAPVTADTRFPIGSISKSMTALALLQLHDQGKVDLNAPVRRYLPWWTLKNSDRPVLVHQLLSHTGGVPDDYTFEPTGFALAALRGARPLFQAGTAWSYSNDGFATVGAIVEAVTGRPWQDAIENTVFGPLGMSTSSAIFTPKIMSNAAIGYMFRDADVIATPAHQELTPAQSFDFVNPAGSVISTPYDMAAYIRFYLNGGKTADGTQLLAPATFAAMTSPDHYVNGIPAGDVKPELDEWPEFYSQYGFGLSIFTTGGDHLIGHTGGISGYTSCMQANLSRGFGAIAMSNLVEAPLHPCAIVKYAMAVLRAQSLGQPLPAAPAGPPIAAPVVVPSQFLGTYHATDGRTVTIATRGSDLSFSSGSSQTYLLEPRGNDLFWTDDPQFPIYYIAFGRNKQNAVDHFTYGGTLFKNDRYAGPSAFSYPAVWNMLTGRYETMVWGQLQVVRIVAVSGHLTIDGITPLTVRRDGTFALGSSTVRFDTPSASKMQRVWIDGEDLYRVNLP